MVDRNSEEWLSEKSEFICSNKWCKVSYITERFRYYEDGDKTCHKCRSFDEDLSGGVDFKKNEYSGTRFDNQAHPVDFKFSDYIKGGWGKIWGK